MKVMCIKNGQWTTQIGPKFLETVTVKGQCPVYPEAWDIVEYPINGRGRQTSFSKKYFIPILEIDETELAEQRLQTA